MRFINFFAVDTGSIDVSNKPIVEYYQTGGGLSQEEKLDFARWALSEIQKEEKLEVVFPTEESRAYKIYNYLKPRMKFDGAINDKVFEILKKLKEVNKGDCYYDAYIGHLQRNPDTFFDFYHVLHLLAKEFEFKSVMEIGCRTGISICQLLSALKENNRPMPENINLFDIFGDGFISPKLVELNIKSLGIDVIPLFHAGDSKVTIPNSRPRTNGLYQYVLVDGDHSREGAMTDLLNVEPLLAQGGVLVFDDISTNPGECGLIDVWNKFKEGREEKYYWLESMVGKGFGLAVKK